MDTLHLAMKQMINIFSMPWNHGIENNVIFRSHTLVYCSFYTIVISYTSPIFCFFPHEETTLNWGDKIIILQINDSHEFVIKYYTYLLLRN
jgi:hypothetical protein